MSSSEYVPNDMEDVATWAARRPVLTSPEKRLAEAVFGEAIIDLQRGPTATGRTRREFVRLYEHAREWVLSDAETEMSFVWLCHVLDFEVDATREGLLVMKPGTPFAGLRMRGTIRPRPGAQRKVSRRPSWRYGSHGPGARESST